MNEIHFLTHKTYDGNSTHKAHSNIKVMLQFLSVTSWHITAFTGTKKY